MRYSSLALFAVTFTSLTAFADGALVGPYPYYALPGFAGRTDSDTGDGRSWGFAGGRTFGYSGLVESNFEELQWRLDFANLALDGYVDDNPQPGGETFFDLTSCTLQVNATKVWCTGVSRIVDTASVYRNVTTTLVVEVSGPGNPTFSSTSPPTVVIKPNTPFHDTFDINVLFEAKPALTYNPVPQIPPPPNGWNDWNPALAFFDAFPTPSPPDGEGIAISGMSFGFYFDPSDLDLAKHDADMKVEFGDVNAKLDGMVTDLDDANTKLGNMYNKTELQAKLDEMYTKTQLENKLTNEFGDIDTHFSMVNDKLDNLDVDCDLDEVTNAQLDNFICTWAGDILTEIPGPDGWNDPCGFMRHFVTAGDMVPGVPPDGLIPTLNKQNDLMRCLWDAHEVPAFNISLPQEFGGGMINITERDTCPEDLRIQFNADPPTMVPLSECCKKVVKIEEMLAKHLHPLKVEAKLLEKKGKTVTFLTISTINGELRNVEVVRVIAVNKKGKGKSKDITLEEDIEVDPEDVLMDGAPVAMEGIQSFMVTFDENIGSATHFILDVEAPNILAHDPIVYAPKQTVVVDNRGGGGSGSGSGSGNSR